MSTFNVQPADLNGFATLIDRAADAAREADRYVRSKATIDSAVAGDLWDPCKGWHSKNRGDSDHMLDAFTQVLEASCKEMKRSAKYYRDTDRKEAAGIDATYPEARVNAGRTDTSELGAGFSDAKDAAAELKAVGGDGYIAGHVAEFEVSPVQKGLGTMLDFGSPSALVNEGLKLAFSFDIFGEINKWLFGDWQSWWTCQEVWRNAANCFDAIAQNIQRGVNGLSASWEGNAADTARVYFENLKKKLEEARDAFNDLGGNYQSAAQLVFELSEFVKAGVQFIMDKAITAAVTAAASMAVSATGVGAFAGLVGGALTAAQILAMIERWGDMVQQFNALSMALTALGTVIAGGLTAAQVGAASFPKPGASYDHRAV